MSVAAREASLLFDLLQRFEGDLPSVLALDFLTKVETLIADPWARSAIPDFIYPDTTGVRPNDLEERLNFQKGVTPLAARYALDFQLLTYVRKLLKPPKHLEDPSLTHRTDQ